MLLLVFVHGLHAGELPAEALERLKADDFNQREKAQSDLLAWALKHPDASATALYRQSRKATHPEQRERCLAVLRDLIGSEYEKQGDGFLGIQMADDEVPHPDEPGKVCKAVRVTHVLPGLAAEKAGMKPGDRIVALNGRFWLRGVASSWFRTAIKGMKPGSKVLMRIVRDGKSLNVEAHLGRRPLVADNPHLQQFPDRLEAAEKAAREDFIRERLREIGDAGSTGG